MREHRDGGGVLKLLSLLFILLLTAVAFAPLLLFRLATTSHPPLAPTATPPAVALVLSPPPTLSPRPAASPWPGPFPNALPALAPTARPSPTIRRPTSVPAALPTPTHAPAPVPTRSSAPRAPRVQPSPVLLPVPSAVARRLPPSPTRFVPLPTATSLPTVERLAVPTTRPTSPPFPRVRTPVPLPPPTPAPTPEPQWARGDRFTVMVLGIDRRDDEPTRADTVMLFHIDLTQHRVRGLSIPRDLVVSIPGYGQDRINVAYTYGEVDRLPGGGVGLTRRVIEENFGVQVDHYVVIDFACFRGAIDAVGGVEVDVPVEIYDDQYPTDDYGVKTVHFLPGRQRLDGERALEYVRTRHQDSDFGRIARQQQVLLALRSAVANPARVPDLIRGALQYCSHMSTDLGIQDMIGLALRARDFDSRDIYFETIGPDLVRRYITPAGADVLLGRWEAIRGLVRDTFRPQRMALGVSGG